MKQSEDTSKEKDSIMSNKQQCALAEGFSIWEKLWAQLSFFGIGIIGTIAITQYNWKWVIPYVIIYWYGIPGIIMRHLNCPRCPHLHEFGDCLQVPVFFTKWIIKNVDRKFTPFTPIETFLFYLIFITIPIYPIYFLASNIVLLIAFLVCVAMWYGGQLFYFCKACRVKECPFNRVRGMNNSVV
ncbi:MAG: hypothetical protein KJO26_05750 [Deltaproteobacteria bacterium]|nr:hypothetical protein [Deltaproteobacteria bacterium]NNK84482.1 hypothetical protein [Desulfobacterales bacterium]